MKTVYTILTMLSVMSLFINCDNDNSNEEEITGTAAKGIITLSGEDTAEIGTQLEVGDINYGRKDLTGLDETIIIVPKGAKISEDAPDLPLNDPDYVESIISFEDVENAFVIVLGQELISMVIVVNGIERRYICDSLFETSIACGSIVLDAEAKQSTLSNVTVKNVETGTILTMNGTVNW